MSAMSHSGFPGKVQRAHFESEVGEVDESRPGFAVALALSGTQWRKGPGKLGGRRWRERPTHGLAVRSYPSSFPPTGAAIPTRAGGILALL